MFTGYTTGEAQYDYDVTFWQASPYAQADVSLPGRVQLSAGRPLRSHRLRLQSNLLSVLDTGSHRRPASTDVSFDRLSPKLGATWELAPNANVFASYREAFRAPSESQLFRQGAAESTVDLKPVRAQSWEAGFRTALGGVVTLEATGYSMRLRDDILTFFDPATGLRLTQNAGATNHRGVELGLGRGPRWRVCGWMARVSYAKHTYVDWQPRPRRGLQRQRDGAGAALPRQRPAQLPAARSSSSGLVAFEWIRLGSYWMDPENTHKYDGHDLFNLYATVPVMAHVELSGRVTNLGDRALRRDVVVQRAAGRALPAGPPRQFFLGAQYRFN